MGNASASYNAVNAVSTACAASCSTSRRPFRYAKAAPARVTAISAPSLLHRMASLARAAATRCAHVAAESPRSRPVIRRASSSWMYFRAACSLAALRGPASAPEASPAAAATSCADMQHTRATASSSGGRVPRRKVHTSAPRRPPASSANSRCLRPRVRSTVASEAALVSSGKVAARRSVTASAGLAHGAKPKCSSHVPVSFAP